MPNFIFQMKVAVTEVSDVKDLIVVRADTQELATRAARAATLGWWGIPTGEDVDGPEWQYDHDSQPTAYIDADPRCKGIFADDQIETIRRACTVQNVSLQTDEDIIAQLQGHMEEGMPQPSAAMLTKLFGAEFAARCAIELS